jgi:hypothetical protein
LLWVCRCRHVSVSVVHFIRCSCGRTAGLHIGKPLEPTMKFNTTTTAIAFVVLLAILLGGTASSPMSTGTVMMVSGGLVVFGVLTLFLGVKHGEYRANS